MPVCTGAVEAADLAAQVAGSHQHRSWDHGPLQEQQVPFTPEPSLQCLFSVLKQCYVAQASPGPWTSSFSSLPRSWLWLPATLFGHTVKVPLGRELHVAKVPTPSHTAGRQCGTQWLKVDVSLLYLKKNHFGTQFGGLTSHGFGEDMGSG